MILWQKSNLHNYRIIGTPIFLFFNAFYSFSQTDSLVFYPVNNPALQQYDIRSIAAAKDGKLWLSTSKGLVSFDGNDVKVFQHRKNDPSSLSSNDVLRTYIDSKGNLYVINSMGERNVNYMDCKTGKFTPLNIGHKMQDFRIMASPYAYTDLFFDDDESIWLAAYYIGFAHYNVITKRTESYFLHGEYSGKNTVYAIKKDSLNNHLLWLGTEDGIYSFNKGTKELKRNFRCRSSSDSSNADLQITQLSIHNPDTVWFTVPGRGFGCYDIKTGFYTIYPWTNKKQAEKASELDIIRIQRKSKNEYYIATDHNLPGVFNTTTHQYSFTTFTSQNLRSVKLNHFLVDGAGNFWCVLYNRLFIARSARDKFTTIAIDENPDKGKNENIFKTIVWDKKRKYYYAGFEKSNRIVVLDSNLTVVKSIPVSAGKNENADFSKTNIYDLGLDKENRLWVCGSSLWVYDSSSQRMVPSNELYPKLLFQNQRFQNLVFKGDYLYLQPSNPDYRAIYRISIKKLVYDSIPLPDEMVKDNAKTYQPDKRVDFLVMDKESRNVYMGYTRNSDAGPNSSIIQLNLETKKGRKVTPFLTFIEHPNSSHMFGYALDDSDRIWIKSEVGIAVYEPENFHVIKRINTDRETYSLQMYNIDGFGLMCRLYSDGVLLYDYKNNRQFRLTLNDGLISYLNSGIACVNNILFVGTSNYIQYIPLASVINNRNLNRRCYLSSIQLFNRPYQTDTLAQYLHALNLQHNKNFVTLTFSSTEFEQQERLEYRYQLEGVDDDWVYVNYLNRTISYNNLQPGNYTFHAAIKNANGSWSDNDVKLNINIIPAWWQTTWFKVFIVLAVGSTVYWFLRWRIKAVRKQEQIKVKYEKELLELEARALRAQMNPHFIFNCINSIKSLIQQNEQDKAISYLTIFSKLIRTIFQNSDKREITLFDEIETCRLYTQLECMRFGNKFSYYFDVEESIDLKSVMIPALIIQPFIENAIGHGIMPKEDGGMVKVSIVKKDNVISCLIDDDGIGREMSKQNKFKNESSNHQSKGVHLTQSRLNLENLLNYRKAGMEIIDQQDKNGKSTGTLVIITFNEY